ncbi:MAG: hypothetical protein WCH65_02205 [bacterium]
MGIGSATKVISDLPDTYMRNRTSEQEAQVSDWINKSEGKVSFDTTAASTIVTKL